MGEKEKKVEPEPYAKALAKLLGRKREKKEG